MNNELTLNIHRGNKMVTKVYKQKTSMFVKAECKDETDEFFKMKESHTQKKKS